MIFDVIKAGISIVSKIVGGEGDKNILQKAADILETNKHNPEVQRAMLDQEVELKKIYAADAADARQLVREESRSEDPFVRRARPAFMWLFYIVIIFNFVLLPLTAAILGPQLVTQPDGTVMVIERFDIKYPVLPEQLYYLFGVSFLGYTGFRSFDKWKKNGKGKS